jgi:Arc/MetJ-type ribon-helix-helix transcriptional regulator
MAIQLTPEQERRIQAIVNAGAYPSAREALDAALAAVEIAAAPGFEGSQEELEGLLLEGLASKELSEEEFWDSVDRETNAMLAAHKPGPRA